MQVQRKKLERFCEVSPENSASDIHILDMIVSSCSKNMPVLSGRDCLISREDCLIVACLISGNDCLTVVSGNDCLIIISGNDCLIVARWISGAEEPDGDAGPSVAGLLGRRADQAPHPARRDL